MEHFYTTWWFWTILLFLIVDVYWVIKTFPSEALYSQIFLTGDKVLFSEEAINELPTADKKEHTVTNVRSICDSIFGTLNCPVELQCVGHSQWVTIENGKEYSGAWLNLIPDTLHANDSRIIDKEMRQ